MKFIHAADLHLDTPFANIKNFSKQLQNDLRRSTYTAATKVFDTAIKEKVDFVILAGDTYDNIDRSLNAQDFLKNQFLHLKENDIKVYLIYGNHDYYRNDFSTIDFPENVFIFHDQPETFELTTHDGKKVGLTGFSYYQRHIDQQVINDYPIRGNFDYQIGILHGGIGDNNYAPFTVPELIAKGYDYWALGHIHKRQILNQNPYVIYPGDTQGRNPNETGQKGFYLVTVLNQQTTLDFIPSSSYLFEQKRIVAQSSDNLASLTTEIGRQLEVDVPTLFTYQVESAQVLDQEVVAAIQRGDLIQHFERQQSNGYLYQLKLKFSQTKQLQEIDAKYWQDSAKQVFDLDDIKDLDAKLYSIDVIREHLNDPDFLDEIKDQTINLINQQFIGDKQ